MPVRKYRSVMEAEDSGSVDPARPDLGRIIADVWAFHERLYRGAPSRGLHKFRTIDELNQHRRRLEQPLSPRIPTP